MTVAPIMMPPAISITGFLLATIITTDPAPPMIGIRICMTPCRPAPASGSEGGGIRSIDFRSASAGRDLAGRWISRCAMNPLPPAPPATSPDQHVAGPTLRRTCGRAGRNGVVGVRANPARRPDRAP